MSKTLREEVQADLKRPTSATPPSPHLGAAEAQRAALQTFNTPFSTQLRVIDREGQPWFIAKDVCDALGLSDTSMALASLQAHDKHQQSLGLRGRAPWLVNESGFYKLVLKSRKPEARKFQD